MANHAFTEGVRPGGLTTSHEIRILLCYILDSVGAAVTREQLEEVLLGEELVNYFTMAESLAQLAEQKLVTEETDGYHITEAGRTVGHTLAQDVPLSIREAAVRGLVRAQQYAAKKAAHQSTIVEKDNQRRVRCAIDDERGTLFEMELYMPDMLSAEAVREAFVQNGDTVYKLVLAALTRNHSLAEKALEALQG